MAALAYVLLPVSGVLAYFNGSDTRMRFHGLQAITLGLLWPAFLYAASVLSTLATQIVWILGAATWLTLMAVAGFGKDIRLPLIGRPLQHAARRSPKAAQ
jgi:uncharacterized membrane protein